MHIFLHKRINYRHVTWYAYAGSHICLRSPSRNSSRSCSTCSSNTTQNAFVFDRKQFSEIMIVHELKCLSCLTFRNHTFRRSVHICRSYNNETTTVLLFMPYSVQPRTTQNDKQPCKKPTIIHRNWSMCFSVINVYFSNIVNHLHRPAHFSEWERWISPKHLMFQVLNGRGWGGCPLPSRLDWIERCLTPPPTQYSLSGRRFYRSKTQPTVSKYWRNTKSTQRTQKYNKCTDV